jgi:hypothetical protein
VKYIVVYISFFFLLLPAKILAQRQFIDLLPSAGHQVPSEVLIDTAIVNDSVMIAPVEKQRPVIEGTGEIEEIYRKEAAMSPSRWELAVQKALINRILQPVRIMWTLGALVIITKIKS